MSTTDTKQESRRETAKRLVNERAAMSGDAYTCDLKLVDAIEAALKERDERAAKIAEAMRPSGGRMWTDEQHACFDALSECANNIRDEMINTADAIRNGDTNA